MADNNICIYCKQFIDKEDILRCENCTGSVHVKCLKRPGTPGDLLGDVFFDFKCSGCSLGGQEILVRKRLPWFMVIVLAIYNLSIQSKGLSREGFFHWRMHICNFIDKNWQFIFPCHIQRKKKWIGTVSGALSHNNQTYFTSGFSTFQEMGWWKLAYNESPEFFFKLYEQITLTKQKIRNKKRSLHGNGSENVSDIVDEDLKRMKFDSDVDETSIQRLFHLKEENSSTLDNENLHSTQNDVNKDSEVFCASPEIKIKPHNDDDDSISHSLQNEHNDSDYTEHQQLMNEINTKYSDDNDRDNNVEIKNESIIHQTQHNTSDTPHSSSSTNVQKRTPHRDRIIQVTTFCVKRLPKPKNILEKDSSETTANDRNSDFVYQKTTKNDQLLLIPGEEETLEKDESGLKLQMSIAEEEESYHKLKRKIEHADRLGIPVPSSARLTYRKLHIRDSNRKQHRQNFDLDMVGEKQTDPETKTTLDRFCKISTLHSKLEIQHYMKISGPLEDALFESPHTSRILPPYIYRNTKMIPPWLRLMCELQHTVNHDYPSRSTIDFCYVRPNHIPAVNALLQNIFWPGIDMSECLSYPDFSVVALYKKLVIGCAFLVPDVTHDEAYVSFLAVRSGWEKSGIGTFMLYHLTQTCMGKDITLHVSASSPAVFLYQKFGFKIKEIVLDFYDKYLPLNSKQSKHALHMKLAE